MAIGDNKNSGRLTWDDLFGGSTTPKITPTRRTSPVSAPRSTSSRTQQQDDVLDWEDLFPDETTTTTTTPPSTTTTTTVPSIKPSGSIVPKPESNRIQQIYEDTIKAERALLGEYSQEEVEQIKKGEGGGGVWGWAKRNVIGTVMDSALFMPLKAASWVGRVGPSLFEESVQLARDLTGRTQKYEPTDYIPVHPDTGKPIAKVGDPVIRNDEELLQTKIDVKGMTDEQKQKATDDLVKNNARTASGSIREFGRQVGSPTEWSTYGFGSIQELQTGNKWIDRGIGFFGDVALDPTTYLSLGTSVPAKAVVNQLDQVPVGQVGGRLLGQRAVEQTTNSIINSGANKTVKELTKEAAETIARETGDKANSRAVQTQARAVVAVAGERARQHFIINQNPIAGKRLLDFNRRAVSRYSAVAPRRQSGAAAREATANTVRNLRQEALDLIDNATTLGLPVDAELRSAQRFVDVITDDVIADIAVKGNAALRGEVADVLMTPGGLRWGIGTRKISIPGTSSVTGGIGRGVSATRRGLVSVPGVGPGVTRLTTRLGEGGKYASDDIYSWRTGLRGGKVWDEASGTMRKMTSKEVNDALERLAEDQVYRALRKSVNSIVNKAGRSLFTNKDWKPYHRSVHKVLQAGIDLNDTVADVVARTGFQVAEVEFAFAIKSAMEQLQRLVGNLSKDFGGGVPDLPYNWFPQTLTEKASLFLSGNSPLARRVRKELDVTPKGLILSTGNTIGDELRPGMRFFGVRLQASDIGDLNRLNTIARNAGFKGDFFDTNASTAFAKWVKKFSDDYAFMRSIADQVEKSKIVSPRSAFVPQAEMQGTFDMQAQDIYNAIDEHFKGVSGALDRLGGILGVSNTPDASGLSPAARLANSLGNAVESGAYLNTSGVLDIDTFMRDVDSRLSFVKSRAYTRSQIEDLRRIIQAKRARLQETLTKTSPTTVKGTRDAYVVADNIQAAVEIEELLSDIINLVDSGLYVVPPGQGAMDVVDPQTWTAINMVVSERVDALRKMFTLDPKKVETMLENLTPQQFRNMVTMAEDAFVYLDNMLVPDVVARADVAALLNNVRRLQDDNTANAFVQLWRRYNKFIKATVTATPGFHTRNGLSNFWQMIAAGGDVAYLREGFNITRKWRDFLKQDTEVLKKFRPVKQKFDMLSDVLENVDPTYDVFNRQISGFLSTKEATYLVDNHYDDLAEIATLVGLDELTDEALLNLSQKRGIVQAGLLPSTYVPGTPLPADVKQAIKNDIVIDMVGFVFGNKKIGTGIGPGLRIFRPDVPGDYAIWLGISPFGIRDPEVELGRFFKYLEDRGEGLSNAEKIAFAETVRLTGAAGGGDIEEVFGTTLPSRIGAFGGEATNIGRRFTIRSPQDRATQGVGRFGFDIRERRRVPQGVPVIGGQTTSEILGAPLRYSRRIGGGIEDYSRLMLTYDGIRQGLTPAESAARTARFLIDYDDLTPLDKYAKLVFPFWMWMSRNLPVQATNMWMNPRAYATYLNFRENFTDEDGENMLLPSYLSKSGAFKAPFGNNIWFRPDLGFPGTGSPSPLAEGVADINSLLAGSPAAQVAALGLTGTQLFTGQQLEGADRWAELIRTLLPNIGTAGRYVSALPGGTAEEEKGFIERILGLPTVRESTESAVSNRQLLSLLGLPITTVGPNEELAALYEQLARLEAERRRIGR